MRSWIPRSIAALTATITIALFSGMGAKLVHGQGGRSVATPAVPSNLARIAGKPNFNGIWEANNTANWDLLTHDSRPLVAHPGVTAGSVVLGAPVLALGAMGWVPAGLGIVEGNEIPYQLWAATRKKENLEHWIDRDPELKCFLPGVPRAMYMPHPFQIVQSTNKIMVLFEFRNAQRIIHLDVVDPAPNVEWMGHSVGRWEGDTLVVDVTSFSDGTWFDRSGDFHSDALHVVERYTPISRDAIRYEATIEDPQVFTRQWKITMPLYRRLEPNAQLMQFDCVQMVEETMLGQLRKHQLVKQWVGETMTIDITRHVPQGDEGRERYISGNPPPQK